MKEPAPIRKTRTWTGRSQLKQSPSLPASRMIQLAHAVSRATAIEKSQSQMVESVPPLAEMSPSTVTSSNPLHSSRVKSKVSGADPALSADVARQIEAQAVLVEQLSAELRAAMAQLKTMTQKTYLEPPETTDQKPSHAVTLSETQPEQAIAAVSQDIALVNSPEASLTQSQQNAASTAQLLRRLRHRRKPSDRLRPRCVEPATTASRSQMRHKQLKAIQRYRWLRQVRRWLSAAVKLPTGMPALLSDAAVWVAIAAAVRVGLQMLIRTYPVLWFPVVLLVAGAAMLTTHQAVFKSAVSSVWGYRLLLVVIGLLLGGRL
ncbi:MULTISPECIES: hypothetical protein [Trichocoleus]|uniref:Uncharacterized protein n=1 Tax=Trichocoleus desertorum GB2-A4 TaxID=2933944 RepID=A0ABV0J4Z4_9CYAN|nr:hypothetical protein [Trichocoleus sp. FACHB-46]MBD1863694.1 hypothetical protein [Trichocoleus sp. FACHB-46]